MEDGSLYRNKRFNAVGFSLTAIRIWQWTSSFFVYASFSLLYAHIHKNRLGENSRMKGVQILGLVSLVYSTFIICFVHIFKTLGQRSWRVFAIVSVPGDLTIMGICLAKITILSFSGVPADCHGLTRENCMIYTFPYRGPLSTVQLTFCILQTPATIWSANQPMGMTPSVLGHGAWRQLAN